MKQQKTPYFPPSPQEVQAGASSRLSLIRYQPGRELPTLERKIIEELSTQRRVMEGQVEKTVQGISQVAQLQGHAAHVFDATVSSFITIQEQSRGKEHQRIIDEYTTRAVSMFGKQVFGMLDIGATNLALEVHRSLYPMPDPPERPKGFWRRLFG